MFVCVTAWSLERSWVGGKGNENGRAIAFLVVAERLEDLTLGR